MAAVEWAKSRGLAASLREGDYPFVQLADGVEPPNPGLMRRLDRLGRRRRRMVRVVSGRRTAWQAWELRMRFLRGAGNLAARCCTRHWGVHGWPDCGRNPLSNHASGDAADCGLLMQDGYVSMGDTGSRTRWRMRRLRLCLPVPGEAWHVEYGSAWRA